MSITALKHTEQIRLEPFIAFRCKQFKHHLRLVSIISPLNTFAYLLTSFTYLLTYLINRHKSEQEMNTKENSTSSVVACDTLVFTRGFGMRSLTVGGRDPGPRLDSAHCCSYEHITDTCPSMNCNSSLKL